MPAPAIIGLIASLASAAYGIGSSISQNKKAKKLNAELQKQMAGAPEYTTPNALNEQLAAARTQMNAPSEAISAMYQQAQQAAADQRAYAQRNAPSGAVALASGAAATQQANSILPAIAQQQQAYRFQTLGNLNNALGAKTDDDRLKFEQRLGRHSDRMNFNLGRMGAAQQQKAQMMALAAQGLYSGLGYAGQMYGGGNQYSY